MFLPSPQAVAAKFVTVATTGFVDATLLQHLAASLGRVFAALVAALLIGIPVGLAIGLSTIGRGIFDPLLEFLRPIPPLAYLPLVIIWFGIGEPVEDPGHRHRHGGAGRAVDRRRRARRAARIASTRRARSAPRGRRSSAMSSCRAPCPRSSPGCRIALGAGWTTLVAAELVAATRGLGFMIQSAAQFLVTDVVIMGIFVIAGVAFLLEFAIRRLERLLVPWAGRE